MCLILLAHQPNDRFQLVIAANRDEFYERPASKAHAWDSDPVVVAGKDVQAGGTWLGISHTGRFAAVTNFREIPPEPIPPASRGDLPTDFLTTSVSREDYLRQVSDNGELYRGFNLLIADRDGCSYVSNRDPDPRHLQPGCYGLSNQLLDCDWPKVMLGRDRLRDLIDEYAGVPFFAGDNSAESNNMVEGLFNLLTSRGDGREFSNSFIESDAYGTRAATVVIVEKNGQAYFEERSFSTGGVFEGATQYRFTCIADF